MKNTFLKYGSFLASIFYLWALASCGTTSGIKPTAKTSQQAKAQKTEGLALDLSKYDRVVVKDFEDQTQFKKKGYKRERHDARMKEIIVKFPDMIAAEAKAFTGFGEVVRNGEANEKTLIISGQVTKYKEGDAAMRLLVGFGAGSANFDANVELRDGGSNELLGIIKVDKNSWAPGGFFAALQDSEKFMEGAARKIGDQLWKLKPKNGVSQTSLAKEQSQTPENH